MEHDDHQAKISFSARGAWLGFTAYLLLAGVIACIFIFG